MEKEAVSTEQEELRLRHPKLITSHQTSASRISPTLNGKPQEHHGCCRGLAVIFSVTARRKQPSQQKLHHCQQVAELKEEIRQQKGLTSAYRVQLEKMQDYLRYCLEIAKANGLLHQIANAEPPSPLQEFVVRRDPEEIAAVPGDHNLEATKIRAKLNGWNIEPHEQIEFHEKIGEGTTADIYRGTWRGLDVAIKRIHPRYFQTNEFGVTWFAQELDTLSLQRHPFVLRLIGACLHPPENGWAVTELLSGKTLTEWLHGHKQRHRERSVPLPSLQERIEKGLEISQAMQYLHEQKPKIIHRDLKPSNILLDDSMHIRVADFGHARFLLDGEQALTGETGTYVYMAPEVIRSEPYNEMCDVYSFGIILNELITGQRPYSDSSFGPKQISFEVAEGRLRPKLLQDNGRYNDIIDLICCSWNQDASTRPSFANITSALRKIQEKLN